MRFLLVLILLLAGPVAQAASLRTATTMHGQNVYLRDLFDGAGRNADRLLGPGPAPGDRIVVEAAQLDAIARQYDVAWRSISSGDRAVLEWPGQPLSRDTVIEAVRAAVAATGDSSDDDIEMPEFSPPTVPAEATPGLTVSQLERDKNTGGFAALLTVAAGGMTPIYLCISGRIDPMIEAPVSVARLPKDSLIRAEDLRMGRVPKTVSESGIARSVEQIVGMQLHRPITAGQPLRLSDLTRPALVRKGELIRVELSAAGLSVAGQVIAIDAGADGEVIRVQNINSRLFLFARVVGPGQVSVTPDAPAAFQTIPARFDRRVNMR